MVHSKLPTPLSPLPSTLLAPSPTHTHTHIAALWASWPRLGWADVVATGWSCSEAPQQASHPSFVTLYVHSASVAHYPYDEM